MSIRKLIFIQEPPKKCILAKCLAIVTFFRKKTLEHCKYFSENHKGLSRIKKPQSWTFLPSIYIFESFIKMNF